MASPAITAHVALGSNLGDREGRLAAALAALRATPGIEVVAVSSVHETEPVGGPPQGPYLNAAAALRTTLSARSLLERLHAIEAAAGRTRGPLRDAPRTLDLDLLFYGAERIEEPGLRVPHPRCHLRAFVLEPLREIAADLVHPLLGETVEDLAGRLGSRAAPSQRSVGPWTPAEEVSPMAIAAVSISPVGEGASVSRYVAAALKVAQQQDRVRWRLDPMFTTLEGELADIFSLVQRMQEAVFAAGAVRVSTVLKVDDRRDKPVRMEDKLRSLGGDNS